MVRGWFRQKNLRCGTKRVNEEKKKTGPWSDVRVSDDAKESHPGLVMRSYGRVFGGGGGGTLLLVLAAVDAWAGVVF